MNLVCVRVCADLEKLSEKGEDIEYAEADLGRYVALQQRLMVDFSFRWPRPLDTHSNSQLFIF